MIAPCMLQYSIDELLERQFTIGTPGMIVSIEKDGLLVYERAIGKADLRTGTDISKQTNFRMASVSKQFTAMGIALLEQQGLLSYHDPVIRFLPSLGNTGKDITLAHLLTHTSGLPDYEDLVELSRTNQINDAEVLELVAKQDHLLFAAGSQFRYSNTGYVLLGLVLEKVSGQPLGHFLKEHIFLKSDMHTTSMYDTSPQAPAIPNRALGYTAQEKGYVLTDQSLYSATKGDGCLYTSLEDYRQWNRALTFDPAFQLAPLFDRISAPIGYEMQGFYSMGWFFHCRKDATYEMYHTGNSIGFSHLVVRIPEEGVLITAFSNVNDNPLLLPHLLKRIIQHAGINLESNLAWSLPFLTR